MKQLVKTGTISKIVLNPKTGESIVLETPLTFQYAWEIFESDDEFIASGKTPTIAEQRGFVDLTEEKKSMASSRNEAIKNYKDEMKNHPTFKRAELISVLREQGHPQIVIDAIVAQAFPDLQ